MAHKDIESWKSPNAEWQFGKDSGCAHEKTRRVNLGSYQDGETSGRIFGKKCVACGDLLYDTTPITTTEA